MHNFDPQFKIISKKIKSEIAKRFSIVDAEMKKDLFQEAFVCCMESKEVSPDKLHWVIVRSLSKFYWANVSIVKKPPAYQKKQADKKKKNPRKEDPSDVFDVSLEDSNLEEFTLDFSEKNEESVRRVAKEYLLINHARKIVSEREWEIIKRRVMTTKEKQKTRSEISINLSISTERVRQIEMNGLNKIKGALSNPDSPLHILHPGY